MSTVAPANDDDFIWLQPTSSWKPVAGREVWAYRELLFYLVVRNLKIRYKQTVLGASWAILQPVLLMVIFTIFLGRLGGIANKVPSGLPYPVFTFVALVPWTLFAQGVSASADSLVSNSNMLSKVYFPRILLPLAAAVTFVVDFLIALVVLVVIMAAYGVAPRGPEVLLVPVLGLFALLAALSIGIWLAALNVRYRDVRYVVPFLVQLWLFLSPVAYPTSQVPQHLRVIYGLNPMAGVIEGFRWALLGLPWSPGPMIGVSVGMTCLLLLTGLISFRRAERTSADVI